MTIDFAGATDTKTIKRAVPRMEEGLGDKTTFKSGAQSSGQIDRFDLLPRTFLQRVAARFTLGAKKYSDRNYRKGFADEQFIIDRMNHIQMHLQAYLYPRTIEEMYDDNLSAIGWGVAFLMECEEDPKGREILATIRARNSTIDFKKNDPNF